MITKDTNTGQFNKPNTNDFPVYFIFLNNS